MSNFHKNQNENQDKFKKKETLEGAVQRAIIYVIYTQTFELFEFEKTVGRKPKDYKEMITWASGTLPSSKDSDDFDLGFIGGIQYLNKKIGDMQDLQEMRDMLILKKELEGEVSAVTAQYSKLNELMQTNPEQAKKVLLEIEGNSLKKYDPQNPANSNYLPPDYYKPMIPDAGDCLSKKPQFKASIDSMSEGLSAPKLKVLRSFLDNGIEWTDRTSTFINALVVLLRIYEGLHFTVDKLFFLSGPEGRFEEIYVKKCEGDNILRPYVMPIGTLLRRIIFRAAWVADVPGRRLPELYLIFEGNGTVLLTIDSEFLKSESILREYIRLSNFVQESCSLIKNKV